MSGRVYFFQSELPYHDSSFGPAHVGYNVSGSHVASHEAYGLGVYIIGGGLRVNSAIAAPSTANLTHVVALTFGGNTNQFANMVCDNGGGAGNGHCDPPTSCSGAGCYLDAYPSTGPPSPSPPPPPSPSPPSPPLSPGCWVGGDSFLQGQAGQNAAASCHTTTDCAVQCEQCKSCLPQDAACKYWKFGVKCGLWCQLFPDDGTTGGWPIPGAANASNAVVTSGTIPGNHC